MSPGIRHTASMGHIVSPTEDDSQSESNDDDAGILRPVSYEKPEMRRTMTLNLEGQLVR